MISSLYNAVAAATSAAINANTISFIIETTDTNEALVSVYLGSKFQKSIPFTNVDVDSLQTSLKDLEKVIQKIA